jgi:hypothetical protein
MTHATASLLAKFHPRQSSSLAIAPADRAVVKRDGTTAPWDTAKVARAIALAFYEMKHGTTENPNRKPSRRCSASPPGSP